MSFPWAEKNCSLMALMRRVPAYPFCPPCQKVWGLLELRKNANDCGPPELIRRRLRFGSLAVFVALLRLLRSQATGGIQRSPSVLCHPKGEAPDVRGPGASPLPLVRVDRRGTHRVWVPSRLDAWLTQEGGVGRVLSGRPRAPVALPEVPPGDDPHPGSQPRPESQACRRTGLMATE